MNIDPSNYAATYREMYDAELVEVARDYDSLTEAAQTAIRSEFQRRRLQLPDLPQAQESVTWKELATVGRYRDLTEAEVARSALESAGIHAQLFDDNLARMNWALSNALGGIRLQVDPADRLSAEDILAKEVPESMPFESTEEFAQPRCPVCGSFNISFEGRSRKAAILSLYLLNVPLPHGRETWVCEQCGARWEPVEQKDGASTE